MYSSNLALNGTATIQNSLTLPDGVTVDKGAFTWYFNTTGPLPIAVPTPGVDAATWRENQRNVSCVPPGAKDKGECRSTIDERDSILAHESKSPVLYTRTTIPRSCDWAAWDKARREVGAERNLIEKTADRSNAEFK